MKLLTVGNNNDFLPAINNPDDAFVSDLRKAVAEINIEVTKGRKAFDVESSVRVFQALKKAFPQFVFDCPESAIPHDLGNVSTKMVFVVASSQEAYDAHEARR